MECWRACGYNYHKRANIFSEEYFMLYIAENLRALSKGKDLTQEDVAEIFNVSPQSVSKWERGDTLFCIYLKF